MMMRKRLCVGSTEINRGKGNPMNMLRKLWSLLLGLILLLAAHPGLVVGLIDDPTEIVDEDQKRQATMTDSEQAVEARKDDGSIAAANEVPDLVAQPASDAVLDSKGNVEGDSEVEQEGVLDGSADETGPVPAGEKLEFVPTMVEVVVQDPKNKSKKKTVKKAKGGFWRCRGSKWLAHKPQKATRCFKCRHYFCLKCQQPSKPGARCTGHPRRVVRKQMVKVKSATK